MQNKLLLWGMGFFVLCGACASAIAQTEEAKSIKVESPYTDSTKVIQVVSKKPEIVLKLKANPSTGYSWFLSHYDHHLLKPVSTKFVVSDKKLVGAPGVMEWRFQVKSQAFNVPQVTHIKLDYMRSWVVTSNVRKMEFIITIQPSASLAAKHGKRN